MQPLSSFLKPSEENKRFDFRYQALGDEMYRHFGKGSGRKVYPLFSSYRYTHQQIYDAWLQYQKTGKNSFEYFMGVLNKLK